MQANLVTLRDPNNNPLARNWQTNQSSMMSNGYLPQMEDSDVENDDFQDAKEDFYDIGAGLNEAFLDAQRALDLFFENKFEEAILICEKYMDVSPVHGMMLTFFKTFFALFSLSKDDLEEATRTLERVAVVNNRYRRQNNFSQNVSNFFFKPNFKDYSEAEIYCEFIAAFYDLIDFMLILFGQPTIISLIKAAIKIRVSSNRFKLCEEIFATRKHWENEHIRSEFEAGLCVGSGGLNLVFSHLPSRVMSIMSVMGFSCDRQKGIEMLDRAFSKRNSLPTVIAGYSIMFYNLYVEQIFGLGEGNVDWARAVSHTINKRYPNSICGIFFSARIKQVMGKPLPAIAKFKVVTEMKDIKCNNISNICYWDMIWCYALIGDYESAAEVARHLSDVCSWSPATNMYQCAVFTYAHAIRTGNAELLKNVTEIMKEVPRRRIRYAGKTIPPEKFAITRAEAYIKNQYLPAPHLELLDVWNVYSNINGKQRLLEPILQELECEINKLKPLLNNPQANLDDYALLLKIKAAIYRNQGKYDIAIRTLNQIFQMQDRLHPNSYVLPNAACDLGLNYVCLNDREKAKHWLNLARSDYSGYLAETIVHFRVHNGLRHLRVTECGLETEPSTRFGVDYISEESDDSGDEGFSGSGTSAASSQQLPSDPTDTETDQSLILPDLTDKDIETGNKNLLSIHNPKVTTRTISSPTTPCSANMFSFESSACDTKILLNPGTPEARNVSLNRSAISSNCVNMIDEPTVQGQKALNRALGGGSAHTIRRQQSINDFGNGNVTCMSTESKRKKNKPILQRMKQKIANKLRSSEIVEQELIKEQLEQDLQRTRVKSFSSKQLKRRFTDWF